MRPALHLLLTVLLLVGCGCNPREAPPVTVPPPQQPPRVDFVSDADILLVSADWTEHVEGRLTVAVEVAASYEARQRGLGGRETLPDGRGMLFVYRDSAARTFWMKDCLIALDIAFLDVDGVIREVATLPPGIGLSGSDIPAHTCSSPIRYVFEVRARWFEERGLGVGATVDVTRVVEGVIAE